MRWQDARKRASMSSQVLRRAHYRWGSERRSTAFPYGFPIPTPNCVNAGDTSTEQPGPGALSTPEKTLGGRDAGTRQATLMAVVLAFSFEVVDARGGDRQPRVLCPLHELLLLQ